MRSNTRKRGSGLVIALVTLLVVTSIMGSIMHALLTELRQTRQTAIEVQAQWLADAGVERAAARLAANPSYERETWKVDLPDSSSVPESHGVVEVKIERGVSEKTAQIIVHANYPDESRRRVSAERIVSVSLPKRNSPASDSRKETNE
jgi:type II secretory pathway component PulK